MLRNWVLPRLFSCVLRPLLPLSLLSPLHPENLCRLPPACALHLQTRKTPSSQAWSSEAGSDDPCLLGTAVRLSDAGLPQHTLQDAGIQLKGCFSPSSSPAQEPAACRGLQAPAPSPPPRYCPKLPPAPRRHGTAAPALPDPRPAQGRRRKAALGCCCSPRPHMGWQHRRGDGAQPLRPLFGS